MLGGAAPERTPPLPLGRRQAWRPPGLATRQAYTILCYAMLVILSYTVLGDSGKGGVGDAARAGDAREMR